MIVDAEELSPERARAILEERARVLARVPERPVVAERVLSVATFKLGAGRYAIEARTVREVGRLQQFSPVPGLPDFVVGVTNLRGEVLAVIDLGGLLGIAGVRRGEGSRLIVLGEEDAELAIVADETDEVVSVAADAVHPPPAHLAKDERAFVRGVTADGLVVLDGPALLSDPRLFFDHSEEGAGPVAGEV